MSAVERRKMMIVHHSVTTSGLIGDDHLITITVPTNMPPGPVRVTVTLDSEPTDKIQTLGELLDSGVLGQWANRVDLPTTNDEFIEWRRRIWDRQAS